MSVYNCSLAIIVLEPSLWRGPVVWNGLPAAVREADGFV